jgi:hypothetical protein
MRWILPPQMSDSANSYGRRRKTTPLLVRIFLCNGSATYVITIYVLLLRSLWKKWSELSSSFPRVHVLKLPVGTRRKKPTSTFLIYLYFIYFSPNKLIYYISISSRSPSSASHILHYYWLLKLKNLILFSSITI